MLQIGYSTKCILWYLEFSFSNFSNKHGDTINKEWEQEVILLR